MPQTLLERLEARARELRGGAGSGKSDATESPVLAAQRARYPTSAESGGIPGAPVENEYGAGEAQTSADTPIGAARNYFASAGEMLGGTPEYGQTLKNMLPQAVMAIGAALGAAPMPMPNRFERGQPIPNPAASIGRDTIGKLAQGIQNRDPYDAASGGGAIFPLLAPLAAMGGQRMASAVMNAIPSTERAGAAIGSLTGRLADVPVDTAKMQDISARAAEMGQAGFARPKVMTDMARALRPDAETGVIPEMPFRQARDFQMSSGELSANERTAIKAPMKAQVKQLAKAMSESTRQVAYDNGVGPQWDSAMREYRMASGIKNAKNVAVKAALPAGEAAIAYEILKSLLGRKSNQ